MCFCFFFSAVAPATARGETAQSRYPKRPPASRPACRSIRSDSIRYDPLRSHPLPSHFAYVYLNASISIINHYVQSQWINFNAMHSFQTQPGCSVNRAAFVAPTVTVSTTVLSGFLISSLEEKSILLIPEGIWSSWVEYWTCHNKVYYFENQMSSLSLQQETYWRCKKTETRTRFRHIKILENEIDMEV